MAVDPKVVDDLPAGVVHVRADYSGHACGYVTFGVSRVSSTRGTWASTCICPELSTGRAQALCGYFGVIHSTNVETETAAQRTPVDKDFSAESAQSGPPPLRVSTDGNAIEPPPCAPTTCLALGRVHGAYE
jgi:hypothetical protein